MSSQQEVFFPRRSGTGKRVQNNETRGGRGSNPAGPLFCFLQIQDESLVNRKGKEEGNGKVGKFVFLIFRSWAGDAREPHFIFPLLTVIKKSGGLC